MADSDAPNEEDAPEGAGFDGEFVEPGPRRSTYTPPAAGAAQTFSLDDTTPPPPAFDQPFNPPPFDDDDETLDEQTGSSTVYSLDDPVAGQPLFAPPSGSPFATQPPPTGVPFSTDAPPPPFAPPAFSADAAASWAPPPFDPPPAPPPVVTDEQLAAAPPPIFKRPVEPDVVEPDVAEPDVAEPAAPLFETPAFAPPVVEPPAFEPPVFDPPVFDVPAFEQPSFDAPAFEEPSFDAPGVDAPIADQTQPPIAEAPDVSAFAPPPPPWGASPATSTDSSAPPEQGFPNPEQGFPSAEEQARLLAEHAGPTSRPWIPERQSLTDEELAAGLAAELEDAKSQPGGVLDAMEQLERQLWLRAEEAREYQDWEQSMLSIGTPEALAAVEEVRPQFEDVVASTMSIPIQYQDAAPPAPPVPPASAEPLETVAAEPELFQEPTFEPEPEDAAPEAAASTFEAPAPTFEAPAPTFEAPAPSFEAPAPEASAPEVSAPAPAPTFDTPAAETPPPAAFDPFDFTASLGATPVTPAPPVEEPESTPDPQTPEPSVAFDPFDFTSLPPTPPALVEPPEPTPPTGEPWQVQVPVFGAESSLPEERTIDPFADLPTPIEPEPVASAPLFVEPVVTPSAFSFDDLLAEDPDQPTPAVETPNPFDLTALPSPAPAPGPAPAVETPNPFDLTALPTPAPTPVFVPDAVVEPAPVVAPSGRRAAIAAEDASETVATETTAAAPGGAIRSLWLWFAANASAVSVALGGLLFSLGMSLRQAVIATVIGLVLSVIPIAVGTVAGRRSGQPTLVVSRATFGFTGNIVPALLAIVTRVFWGAALLWVLGTSVASVLTGASMTGGLGRDQLVLITMGAGFVISLLVAFFGARIIAVFQLVVAVVSLVLVVGLIALTWQYVQISTALSVQDGPVTLLVTGAVLVFSVVGLVWAMSSGDLATGRRSGASRAGAALFASLGTVLPVVVLVSYGALLAASNPVIAKGLVSDPIDTVGRILPLWYPVPLIAAVALSLLSGIVVLVSSGASALVGAGLRISPAIGALVIAVLVFAFGWLISTSGNSPQRLVLDLATTVAVPVAAFVGIFAADVLIRRRSFDVPSLLSAGGVYPRVRWTNLVALVVITGIGWGLTTATVTGLDWQGYLLRIGGITGDLAATDLGVLVALVLGLLISLGFGVREVRRQEALEAPL